jgi:hypothetical protein
MVSTVIPVPPFDLVIFGATGDLARRKILPSLYRRLRAQQMPPEARVIGAARTKMSRSEFRKSVVESLETFAGEALDRESVQAFLNRRLRHRRRGRRGGLAGARQGARPRPRAGAGLLPVGGAVALRHHRRPAAQRRPRDAGEPHRRREAARQGPRLGPGAQRPALGAFRRAPDLPDRPLPRQGDGPEPDGDPFRQRALRAAVERPPRRPRPDHRRRDRRRRGQRAPITTSPARCGTWCRTT